VPSITASPGDAAAHSSAAGVAPQAARADEARTLPTFEQIYAERFDDVIRWLRALGGLDADLDDLAQEVFLVVQRKLHGFDGGNLGAWLFKIAKNQVSDHRRRAWVRRVFRGLQPSTAAESVPLHGRAFPTPHEALERREAWSFVAQTLNKMPLAQRTAFVLFEIEGYGGEEIAELEGIPLSTVWTRVHYARRLFYELTAKAERQGKLR
jgi:RNA polymerase sigma-70 factor (ECF subfamily)